MRTQILTYQIFGNIIKLYILKEQTHRNLLEKLIHIHYKILKPKYKNKQPCSKAFNITVSLIESP